MKLILKDKSVFEGESFGADVPTLGEVVFNTGMVGYVESLSDPSYAGQILVCTYPLVGNYGVPAPEFFESKKIHAAGLVVSEYSEKYSSHAAKESLSAWLKRSGVPALSGVDTRAITKKLRAEGVMLGQLLPRGKAGVFTDPNEQNLVAAVSTPKREVYGNGKIRIVAVDCGMKENIVRSLLKFDVTVIRVPWDYDFTDEEYDGLFLSNGPGDPTTCGPTVANIKKAMKTKKPILGICLGIQLLALAAGASTYKLKYGHRGHNQTCIDVVGSPARAKGRCYITSQNHGYSVDKKTLPKDWEVWFESANDGSVEGIRHKTEDWSAVQFHPEAAPGPTDTKWIFEDFIRTVERAKKT